MLVLRCYERHSGILFPSYRFPLQHTGGGKLTRTRKVPVHFLFCKHDILLLITNFKALEELHQRDHLAECLRLASLLFGCVHARASELRPMWRRTLQRQDSLRNDSYQVITLNSFVISSNISKITSNLYGEDRDATLVVMSQNRVRENS